MYTQYVIIVCSIIYMRKKSKAKIALMLEFFLSLLLLMF